MGKGGEWRGGWGRQTGTSRGWGRARHSSGATTSSAAVAAAQSMHAITASCNCNDVRVLKALCNRLDCPLRRRLPQMTQCDIGR